MSASNPTHHIARQSVVGMEGLWCKMFDPPTASPDTPDKMIPNNPVPEVMALAGFQDTPSEPHVVQRDLMHGEKIPTWDGAVRMEFFLIRDADNDLAVGTFPGPAVRVPRGVIFHSETQGHGQPPHTIHWHGIEPTPMNDGVGHCSMELGRYVYQWQPSFIGFYFYHCHRNTVQHFEFGLYGVLFVEAPDAYFASLNADGTLNLAIPIGAGRDGLRRIAANLKLVRGPSNLLVPESYVAGSGHGFEGPLVYPTLGDVLVEFPGFNDNPITAPDPLADDPDTPAHLKFLTDPHAMTVPYDVEVVWVPDDRDSLWSEEGDNARATYPKFGDIPGVNDNFAGNWGGGVNADDFFAFNDFRPDYFYVTGVPVPAHRVDKGGTGVADLPFGVTIPPELNSGISGTQVSVHAEFGQTVLLRALNAAYACVTYTLPVDAIIIAWDGRALGVPPFGECNHPYLVPAGTPIHVSVARRFDALIKVDEAHGEVSDYATVEFIDTRDQVLGTEPTVLMTARIPFYIGPNPPEADLHTVSGKIKDENGDPMEGVEVKVAPHCLGATPHQSMFTDANGEYVVTGLTDGMYQLMPVLEGYAFTPPQIDVTLNGEDIVLDEDNPDEVFVGAEADEEPEGLRIRGTIVDAEGTPIEGVSVTLEPLSEGASPEQTVATDDSGRYQFDGLLMGEYRIRPSMDGVTFTPDRIDLMVHDMNVDDQDFAGDIVVVIGLNRIRGFVLDELGVGIEGISVTLEPRSEAHLGRTVLTNANGRYEFNDLANGDYRIRPVTDGFAYTPNAIDVVVLDANVDDQNFAATIAVPGFAVSGNIGAPVAGIQVVISADGTPVQTVVTDAEGAFVAEGVPNGQFQITPIGAGFQFTPAFVTVTVNEPMWWP